MEKYGVGADIQHTGLRNQEASLMQKIQAILSMGEHGNQEELQRLEDELTGVRNKLTELDVKTE